MILIFFNVLRCCFVANIWSILENIICEIDKNVFSAVVGWHVLHKSVRSNWLIVGKYSTFYWLYSLIYYLNLDIKVSKYYCRIISSLNSVHYWFKYLRALLLCAYVFITVMPSFCTEILINICASLFPVNFFTWNLFFLATPAILFWLIFAWNTFFHCFTFNLFVSFYPKWVSCTQQRDPLFFYPICYFLPFNKHLIHLHLMWLLIRKNLLMPFSYLFPLIYFLFLCSSIMTFLWEFFGFLQCYILIASVMPFSVFLNFLHIYLEDHN